MKTLIKNKITVAYLAIILIVASALIVALFNRQPFVAHASEIGIDTKVVSRATIEENFTDNAVIVVLNGQATRNFRQYTAEDFAEVNAVEVMNLSARTGDLVQRQIAAERTGDRRSIQSYIDNNMLVNTDTFRTILMVQLAERSKENVLNAIRILEQRDDIVSAEPNYIQRREAAHPNEANLRAQWVRDITRTTGNIRLEDAWDWTTGNATVLVGVIDTGIDGAHPDLTNRIQRNLCADFSTQNLGTLWGLLPSTIMTPNPIDNDGHGTHVAGIIGAQGVNNGVAGVNQNVRLVSLRVFNDNGDTTTQILNRAIDYAQDNNIPIVNYSIGGFSASNSTRTAISNYSGFFVCSTGNTGGNNDVTHHYPSYYANTPGDALHNMIAVGRINNADGRPGTSNYGATTVNIFAPGQDILNTFPMNRCDGTIHAASGFRNCEDPVFDAASGLWFRSTTHTADGYHRLSGSSMATPHVAGVAALIRALRPNMTPAQMRTALIDSAETITINIPDGSGGTTTQNVRRLNALRALQSAVFTTSVSGNNCTITGVVAGVTLPANLVIPENYNGRTVTQIGNSAFANQTQLSQITIPNSITNIDSSAFENCTSLTNVTLPNNLTNIGSSAFKGCVSLGSITIPNTVTNIGPNAFNNCSNLSNVTLPNNLPSIGNSIFNGCSALTSITIPNSVTSIGSEAFKDCCSLTNLTIPSSVTSIGSEAFRYCTSLTNITIPRTVTTIGSNAFFGCSLSITWNYNPALSAYNFRDYLSSVVVGSNVTSVSNYAFKDCPNLTSINISNSVTSIGYEAFWGCSRLTNIVIPNSVTYLGEAIFRDCSSLTEVFLPDGLTTINDTTFWGCSSLSNITIPNDVTYIGLGAFSGCSSLLSIIIPDGVTDINIETFSYCTSLTSVTIGSSVESIGFDAFRYCVNLDSVIIKKEYPNITILGYEAFYGCDPYISFYVPYNSLIYYKGASDWSDYSSRIMTIDLIPECGFENNNDYTMTYYKDAENYYLFIIWVVDEGNYRISFNSTSAFQIEFYDEDANLEYVTQVTDPSNLSGYFDYEIDFPSYMYYIVVKFTDPLASGSIETTVACLD